MPAPSAPTDPKKGAVYGYVQTTDATTLAGYNVVAYLGGPAGYDGEFLLSGTASVIPKTQTAVSAVTTGLWSMELYGNDQITPAGSFWRFKQAESHINKIVELAAASVIDLATIVGEDFPTGGGFTPPAQFVLTTLSYANPPWITSLAYSKLTGLPKKYVALLSQAGTSPPVATVLENTLGGTVVWTRDFAGAYSGTLAGAFTSEKTICHITQGTDEVNMIGLTAKRVSNDSVFVASMNGTSLALGDDLIDTGSLSITVYP